MIEQDFMLQLDKVITTLEERLQKEPDKLIIKTLYDRYVKAKQILLNNEDVNKILIKGGCRAYLDSFSDYMNPMLMEMDKAEKLLIRLKESQGR